MRSIYQNKSSGFTLIEILVISPIIVLMIGSLIALIISMTGEVMSSRANNLLTYNTQYAIDKIESDIKLSVNFLPDIESSLRLQTPTLGIQTPQGYDNATANFQNVDTDTNRGAMLILQSPLTDKNPLSLERKLVYLPQPNACTSAQVDFNNIMMGFTVYFVKDNALWKRTFIPTLTSCSTPWQQPSCAPGTTHVNCKTEDIKLISGIATSDFKVSYYAESNSAVANTVASDPLASSDSRRAALSSTTSVRVEITGKQTVAGRDITQNATARVNRLNSNIEAEAPDAPTAPVVTASYTAPDSAKFTWPAVPGASSYTVEYNINGGTWYTASSGTVGTTYTKQATRKDVVAVRVSATNNASISDYGQASYTIPNWNKLVLQSSWYWYDPGNTYSKPEYTKTSDGLVVVKGMLEKCDGKTPCDTPVAGEVIGQLPVGYRPPKDLMFQTSSNGDSSEVARHSSRIDVKSNGDIVFIFGNLAWTAINGISFFPASVTDWTALPLANGWTNYSATGESQWENAAYRTDSFGRTHLRGLVKPGGLSNNTGIGVMPANKLPSQYMHLPARSDQSASVGINISGNTGSYGPVAKPGIVAGTYLSINAMFYPASYAGWTNMTLLNGWGVLAGYTTPQYTKTADGMVTLKGLIKDGSTLDGTVIATLPMAYAPKERMLMALDSIDEHCRADILTNGNIELYYCSNAWTSLDAINYLAD